MTGDRVHPVFKVLVGCLAVVVAAGAAALVFLVVLPLLGVTLTVTWIVLLIAILASLLGVVLAGIGDLVIRGFGRAGRRRERR
jgi:amino acid permease